VTSTTYQFGEWRVDPARNLVSRDDVERHLEPRAMDALVHLLEHADETISAEGLLDAAWPGRVVEPNAVQRVVNRIRGARRAAGCAGLGSLRAA
jgi:DNA-binding winged helix-turn-helix (wHTH) protein